MTEGSDKEPPARGFFYRHFVKDLFSDDPKLIDKPLLFPRHETRFKHATWAITAGTAFYLLLFADFGNEEHILTSLRRGVFGHARNLRDKFIHLDTEEEIKLQEKIEKIELEQRSSS